MDQQAEARPLNDLGRARVHSLPILQAIERARGQLLSLQREDGHWCGELEGDSILESEYALLLYYLDKLDPQRADRLAERLRFLQQPQGGWAIYPGGAPEVSASVKAYFVLKLLGDDPSAPHMERARKVILGLGGIEAVNSFTRFYLALLGQIDWSRCPAVPPELLMLPRWSPVNLYEMSSWSRAMVVPLSVLWSKKPVRAVPRDRGISELTTGREPPMTRQGASPWENSWRLFFHGLDRTLKGLERSNGFSLSRSGALERAERWILDRLQMSDGLGAIFPSMVYSVIALTALGHSVDGPVVGAQLDELRRLEIWRNGGLRVQPCVSPVWDTALMMNALAVAGIPADDPALRRGAQWLLEKEVRNRGDWCERTRADVGGWYFEYANEFYPDIDDTCQVLTTFSRLRFPDRREAERVAAARRRGRNWILAMQNADGGWAAFDRDCTREVLTCVPFADHNAMLDPSCPDITGRVMDSLMREGTSPEDPAIKRAIRYLERTQEPDGCWYGRWGCNYVYGTYLALSGLRAAGYDLTRGNVQRAAQWLRKVQNPDGGWGESYRTYEDPETRGVGESTAAQTAWALLGLMASGDRSSGAVERGIEFLLHTQGDDGTWHDGPWTGTGFPRVFYLRYDYYDDYFPLLALGAFARGGVH